MGGSILSLAMLKWLAQRMSGARVIGYAVDRVVFRTEQGDGPSFVVVSIAAPLVLCFSRQREFRADPGAARWFSSHPPVEERLERLRNAS